jgi:hypothetical protein
VDYDPIVHVHANALLAQLALRLHQLHGAPSRPAGAVPADVEEPARNPRHRAG